MEPLIAFITIFALLPVFGFAAVKVIWWMVMGEMDFGPGLLAVVLILSGFVLACLTPNPWVQGGTVVGMISLLIMFRFAADYLDRHDLREINVDRIERSYEELAIRPDNFPAWFSLARSLYEQGYRGHGIALAEQTLARIPTERDAISNRSLRELFTSEEREVRGWRADSAHPRYHRGVRCPRCRRENQPGTVNCLGCGEPYLLLLARGTRGKGKVYGRLVVGWAVIAVLIPFSAWSAVSLPGALAVVGVFGGLVVGGLVLWWVFRGPTGSVEFTRPFS